MSKTNVTPGTIGIFLAAAVLAASAVVPASAQQSRNERWRDAHRAQAARSQNGSPQGNSVYWNGCCQPGSIKMGTDPDPFIRQQILRDASGFFGGGDN